MYDIEGLARRGRKAARILASAGEVAKNKALLSIADALDNGVPLILEANGKDLEAAEKRGISKAMTDRLALNRERIRDIAQAVRQVAALEDPVGKILDGGVRPNGLEIRRITVPLGLVGVIYEARPNVTVDIAALCLKAGNVCILRGGSEALHSNLALAGIMRQAVESAGLRPDSILLVEDTSREVSLRMMKLNGLIDLLIPRGGKDLIRSVVENASVPVIETGAGNCHLYVDKDADLSMAADILYNGKVSRPSVCNALETLLVHRDVAREFLPMAKARLDQASVEWRGDPQTIQILGSQVTPATEEDYYAEYNDYILACKVVGDIDEAIEQIEAHSTRHSDAIVTKDVDAGRKFLQQVDSAAVYLNASTRFTDGGEFGMGAEVGISTQKLHARGPMGLAQLTSYKYIVVGHGQVR